MSVSRAHPVTNQSFPVLDSLGFQDQLGRLCVAMVQLPINDPTDQFTPKLSPPNLAIGQLHTDHLKVDQILDMVQVYTESGGRHSISVPIIELSAASRSSSPTSSWCNMGVTINSSQ